MGLKTPPLTSCSSAPIKTPLASVFGLKVCFCLTSIKNSPTRPSIRRSVKVPSGNILTTLAFSPYNFWDTLRASERSSNPELEFLPTLVTKDPREVPIASSRGSK